jgi:hypothetical protein
MLKFSKKGKSLICDEFSIFKNWSREASRNTPKVVSTLREQKDKPKRIFVGQQEHRTERGREQEEKRSKLVLGFLKMDKNELSLWREKGRVRDSRNMKMKLSNLSPKNMHTLSHSGIKIGEGELPFIDYGSNPFLAYNFKNKKCAHMPNGKLS